MTAGRTAAALVLALAVAEFSAVAPARAGSGSSSDLQPTGGRGYGDLSNDLGGRALATPRKHSKLVVDGYLRVRGAALYNLDLDDGLLPSGKPLFPVPLADPTSQWLTGADTRFRTDLSFYPPGSGVVAHLRVDVLDNLALGSTPEGDPPSGRAPTPAASPGQKPPVQAMQIKRAYGEVLTPLGLLAAGRMGAQWGLGIVANGGDCLDCDGGDAADRIAFLTPIGGLLWAASYDFSSTGPLSRRKDGVRTLDLEPTDAVHTLTFAVLHYHTPLARARLLAAGESSVEYGAYVSHRTQQNDIPASYLPTSQPVALTPGEVMARGYRADAFDLWARWLRPEFRLEAEGAYILARVDQPSLIPGVLYDSPVTSHQLGVAFESDYRPVRSAVIGVDAGYASGDSAPGFGAFPTPGAAPPKPGDLDGAQANPPYDNTVDNFRFHPDYRIDRILFHEIIGTVTDATYIRPHASYALLNLGTSAVLADVAGVASWAVDAASTPGGKRYLGFEIDPTLRLVAAHGITAALEYAALFPGPGLDNRTAGKTARPAQLFRLLLAYRF